MVDVVAVDDFVVLVEQGEVFNGLVVKEWVVVVLTAGAEDEAVHARAHERPIVVDAVPLESADALPTTGIRAWAFGYLESFA